MKRRRLRGVVVGLAVGLALAVPLGLTGCARHEAPPAPAPDPLPDAPPRLLASGSLARPDAAWTDVQKQIGALGSFLPATFAGVVGSMLDIDGELTALVDGGAPLYFAVQAGSPSPLSAPRWALALPVKDVARVAALLGGQAAEAGAGAVLVRVPAAPRYLVVASDRAAAIDLAPYVTRVLPEAPRLVAAPDAARALLVEIPHDALAGPLATLVSSRWADARADLAEEATSARARHGGRSADFADPEVILKLADGVVAQAGALLADLDHASIRIALGGQGGPGGEIEELASAQVTLTPVAGGTVAAPWVQGLAACDPKPLGAASLDAAVAALLCSHADDRVSFAATLGSQLREALGARLSAADGDRLQKALTDLARARGERDGSLTGALSLGSGLRLETALASDAAADGGAGASAREAIRILADLGHAPGFAEPLAADLGLRVRPPGDGVAVLDRVAPASPPARARPGHAGAAAAVTSIAWSTDAAASRAHPLLTIAAGPDAPASLAPPTRALADDPRLSALLAALSRPSLAILVQPQMATSALADAHPHAGIALALGTTGASPPEAYLRLVAEPGLVRSLARLATGF